MSREEIDNAYITRHFKCPHCGYIGDMSDWLCDGGEDLVTYWGDDGPVEISCLECDETIVLKEHVGRHWEILTEEKRKRHESRRDNRDD
jgi:DNA-directed RNA polymerase subunit RPC12/RpoP